MWNPVDIPGSGRIVTLTGAEEGLLIGRYDAAADSRATLDLRHPDGRVASVPLTTGADEYGHKAELLSISAHGRDIVALGGVRAGAHGNVRWTIWRGTSAGLQEQPQRFETFGGWEAGLLIGAASTAAGPLVVGTRVSSSSGGMDVTAWEPQGQRWVQPSPGVITQASPTSLPSPGAITAAGSIYVVAGWVTRLDAGVREEPTVWFATHARGPWKALTLPVPASRSPIRPTDVSCAQTHCAVLARTDDVIIHWRLALKGDRLTPPRTATTVPEPTHDDGSASVAVAATTRGDVVAYTTGTATRTRTVHSDGTSTPTQHAGTLAALVPDTGGMVFLATTSDGTSAVHASRP